MAAHVELNPVKAKMVKNPKDYRWSSVHAHLSGIDPLGVVDPGKLLEICGDWKKYRKQSLKEPADEFIRHARTGRPLGSDAFIKRAEKRLNRDLQRKKPGPKVAGAN